MSQNLTSISVDQLVAEIIDTRHKLKSLDYSHPEYDHLENTLHSLEDELNDSYEDLLMDALVDVYDEYCSDNDVLDLGSYLTASYKKNLEGYPAYELEPSTGVQVNVDEFEGQDSRIAILPYPLRIVLDVANEGQKVIWQLN